MIKTEICGNFQQALLSLLKIFGDFFVFFKLFRIFVVTWGGM